jgi:RNA polymerase sigma factor (sigma-70 family)
MLDTLAQQDEQLIDLYLVGAPEEAESAFEALVLRHRPAVMSVSRRILGGYQDAEDAAQATFVALVRNAGKIRNRRLLGAWLYGVAYRIAIRMKAQSARRHAIHSRVGERVATERAEDAAASGELRQILLGEVNSLPEEFRSLVVHSYLEGRSLREVARILECPIGTVKGRLWRARGLLRQRLSSRVGRAAEILA